MLADLKLSAEDVLEAFGTFLGENPQTPLRRIDLLIRWQKESEEYGNAIKAAINCKDKPKSWSATIYDYVASFRPGM